MPGKRITFITGTDTGVGKTVLTALLLSHLRRKGHKTLAVKPFCSGDRADAELFSEIQDRELTLTEINPWFFPQPVAPLVGARSSKRQVMLAEVCKFIKRVTAQCDWVLVEGAGGLLAPLGEGYCLLDVIRHVKPQVIVVAQNKLGTINHTLLTVGAIRAAGIGRVHVALIDPRADDPSSKSNPKILAELLAPVRLTRIPHLGSKTDYPPALQFASRRLAARLSRVLG